MLLHIALPFCIAVILAIGFPLKIAAQQDELPSSGRIDLSDFRQSFNEDFDKLDISPYGPGTRWTAHTPWNGDFGDAVFADPSPGFPFTVRNGILRIEARRDAKRQWRSGLLASTDSAGVGFSQQYGYFEIRAKLPSGPGVWPAFWLSSIADATASSSVEIDVFEYYGHVPAAFHSVMHVWPLSGGGQGEGHIQHVTPNSLSDDFNVYGVLVEPDWTRFYLNRVEYWRVKTPAEHTRPLLVLVNLALGSGWPIDQTPSPSYLFVDYIRVYVKQDATHTVEQRAVMECAKLATLGAIAHCVTVRLIDADVEKCLRGDCFGPDDQLTRLLRNAFGRSGTALSQCGNYAIASLSGENVGFARGRRWKLCSGNELIFQNDGNLVLFSGSRSPLWSSGTANQRAVQLSMQADGNLVIYNMDGTAIWSTNTSDNFGATLAIQEDGNVVIYGREGQPLWSADTTGR